MCMHDAIECCCLPFLLFLKAEIIEGIVGTLNMDHSMAEILSRSTGGRINAEVYVFDRFVWRTDQYGTMIGLTECCKSKIYKSLDETYEFIQRTDLWCKVTYH